MVFNRTRAHLQVLRASAAQEADAMQICDKLRARLDTKIKQSKNRSLSHHTQSYRRVELKYLVVFSQSNIASHVHAIDLLAHAMDHLQGVSR